MRRGRRKTKRSDQKLKEDEEDRKEAEEKNDSDRIIWHKKEGRRNATSLPPSATVSADGTLTISGTSASDAGKYVCSFRRGSRLRSSTAELEVTPRTPPTCAPDEFRCVTSGECISVLKRCDWKPDCGDGDESDEEGCDAILKVVRYIRSGSVPRFRNLGFTQLVRM